MPINKRCVLIMGIIFSLVRLLTTILSKPPPTPPTPQHMGNKHHSWHYCSRPRKDPASGGGRRRHIKTVECKGGENGGPCLSCQLKIAQNTFTFGEPFRFKMYIRRIQKRGRATNNLQLVTNLVGVPMYDGASWIIQVLLCDYLDEFCCLHLVQPPDGYQRNPAYVRRDEDSSKAKQHRIKHRGVSIIHDLKVAMKGECKNRFGLHWEDKYNRLQPDWVAYYEYCIKKWLDDEVPKDEIQKEAQRLIDSALEQDPTIAVITYDKQVVVDEDDEPTEQEWTEAFEYWEKCNHVKNLQHSS